MHVVQTSIACRTRTVRIGPRSLHSPLRAGSGCFYTVPIVAASAAMLLRCAWARAIACSIRANFS